MILSKKKEVTMGVVIKQGNEANSGLYRKGQYISWETLIREGMLEVNGTTLNGVHTEMDGHLVVSRNIREIVPLALLDCRRLSGITIPASVLSVELHGLRTCTSLEEIKLVGKTMIKLRA